MQNPSLYEIQSSIYQPNWVDLVLLPIYIFILLFMARMIIWKFLNNSPLKQWVMPGLLLKMIGALFITLSYTYYYKGGDTSGYYNESRLITEAILDDPSAIKLIWQSIDNRSTDVKDFFKYFNYSNSNDTFTVILLTTFVNLFTFNSFFISAIVYSFISFWCMFAAAYTFSTLEKAHSKGIMIGMFFFPNVFAWSSGILKDTICLSSLCIIHFCIFQFFERKKITFFYTLIFIVSFYLLLKVRIFIIACYLIVMAIYIYLKFRSMIKNTMIKNTLGIILIVGSTTSLYQLFDFLSSSSKLYNIETIFKTAKTQRDYIYYISQQSQGSTYTLGDFDFESYEVLFMLPSALNVSLFRPYLWEVKNIMMLFSALEASFVLYFFGYVMLKMKRKEIVEFITYQPVNVYIFIFSILYLILVGLTSYNFGSLVRYKTLAYPFFLILLMQLYYKARMPYNNPKAD
ncbi:MAG: hypothetical protein MUE33_04715 [Cytophagaceae bacterium]|jgi:hypothetical protein|nr:hypothetical protein [Cytophagaceae bacterium]